MVRLAFFTALTGALLVGLWWFTQPRAPSSPTTRAESVATTDTQSTQAQIFTLRIAKGQLVSGSAQLQAKIGDTITLRVTADQADELHIHGYDLHLELTPEQVGTLRFTAIHTGRFDIELHRSHREIAALEIFPR